MDLSINFIAVVSSAVVSLAIGAVWYSKTLFGNHWVRFMGYTKEEIVRKSQETNMTTVYVISFICALLKAYMLAHVMGLSRFFYDYGTIQTGLTSALCMWLGFIMPVQLTGDLFAGKRWQVFAINTGYQLVGLLVAGVIIGSL